jgi:O-antigen/teichoic acid export membrane protein
MSWQESASMHINDDDREEFFSNMVNRVFIGFSCISLMIIAILPFAYNIIIGKDYISSYNYIPILLYANSWNVMISLLGGIYIALKKTKEIANTTIASAMINLLTNLLLIKWIGLYAACISTLISYFLMSIYRHIDIKKYINIKIDYLKIILFTIVFTISTYCYFVNNDYLNYFNLIFTFSYSAYACKSIIKGLKQILIKKHKKVTC